MKLCIAFKHGAIHHKATCTDRATCEPRRFPSDPAQWDENTVRALIAYTVAIEMRLEQREAMDAIREIIAAALEPEPEPEPERAALIN